MNATTAVFLDIRLPNAVTWFYFTFLLAVALFFKFSRLLSIRNLDLITLFLLMPGLLLLQGPGGGGAGGAPGGAKGIAEGTFVAYVWLLVVSGYYFARCLLDLALARRPALGPNLGLAGLAWLAGTLYVSLVAVTVSGALEPEGWRVGQEEGTPRCADEGLDLRANTPPPAQPQGHAPGDGWFEPGLNLACHLAIAAGLLLIARAHFEDLHAGMAAAALYLLLPYSHFFLAGRGIGVRIWEHVFPPTLLVWALFAYRRPALAGALLGAAAGSAFFPVFLLPAWVSFYGRRGMARFLTGFAVALVGCLAALGVLWFFRDSLPVPLPGPWPAAAWQPWLPPDGTRSIWQPALAPAPIHWIYRAPVLLAYGAFLLATAFWPAPKNLAHLIALTAALLIGIQFWYADRGGVYVFWYLPFLLLLTFRPNLSAATAPPLGDTRAAAPRPGRLARVS